MATLYTFIGGVLVMGFSMSAFYFFKFWHRTGDRVFLCFGAAFLLLAFGHALGAFLAIPDNHAWSYLPRLAAFLLIMVAIITKNLGGGRAKQ